MYTRYYIMKGILKGLLSVSYLTTINNINLKVDLSIINVYFKRGYPIERHTFWYSLGKDKIIPTAFYVAMLRYP